MVYFLLISVLFSPPVYIEPGDEIPYAGVLTSTPDAARMVAKVISQTHRADSCEVDLAQITDQLNSFNCDSELNALAACQDSLGDVVTIETIPAWGWFVYGVTVVLSLSVGVWAGSVI